MRRSGGELDQCLVGKVFGILKVVKPIRFEGETFWICKCRCGKTTQVRKNSLVKGTTTSCGCIKKFLYKMMNVGMANIYKWKGFPELKEYVNRKARELDV